MEHNITKDRRGALHNILDTIPRGDEVIYHIGEYAGGYHKTDAMDLCLAGKCILYQRKVEPGKFHYIARKPLKLVRDWQVGDPVGMGEVYLPTTDSKEAYSAACNEALLDSAAEYAMELKTVEARRDFIATWPENQRNALKAKIKTLWETQND